MRLRLATVDDIEQLVMLFATFFRESHYQPHLEFNPAICAKYLTTAIRSGFSPYVVADLDGHIVGTISYHLDDSFTDKLAVMDELYCLPEFRKSPVGRALVHAAMDMAKGDGASCIHIPLSSGHKNMPTLINLFRKFGAEEIGVIMRKVL
jgi:GNAT superfamily N-acetyltransferase